MPKVSLDLQNKVAQNTDYPKFTLDHKQTALIVCIEPEPTVEYVHTLRAPQLDERGNIMKEIKKNKDGAEYEATEYEFIGQHLCFGDFNVVSEKGTDPDNCPTCRAAVEEEGILPPVPRYAMHIIRYATQPGGWQLRDPFSVSLEAWVFSATRFNQIIDLATDANGDLRKYDVRIGPCENKKFQKYEINLVGTKEAAWLLDDERKKLVRQVYANQQCPDLSNLIGRKIDKTKALEDIATVVEKIQKAYGKGNATSEASNVQQKSAEPKVSFDDPWSTPANSGETQDNWPSSDASVNKETGEVSEPTPDAPAAADEPKKMQFSDILADL